MITDGIRTHVRCNQGFLLIFYQQTPPAFRKHPGGDRTGNFTSRPKMTQELASVINDGLYHYEQELWDDDTWEEDDFDYDICVSHSGHSREAAHSAGRKM